MEAMDKRKKDRLIKGTVLNAFVFVGCLIYIYAFVVPKYEQIGAIVANVNNVIADTSSLKENWVDKSSFVDLLNRTGKRKEVADVIFSDPQKLDKVLKKPATEKWDYLAWLVSENSKINLLDKEIQQNEAILGNIIPIFVNSSSIQDDMDNQITLASFISYVEKDILGRYSLTSYAPLGISNIAFPDKKETPVNIGSFNVTFDFKGKNNNILSLIDTLQKSGKLTIRNWKLVSDTTPITSSKEKGLSELSNLLVTIDAISLDSIPETSSADNKGSMTLRFYVEGMDYQKIVVLRSLLTAKFDALQKSTREKWLLCAKPGNPLCNETVTANAVAAIKGLTKNLLALKPKFDTFKKGDLTVDINKEMDTLFDIKMTLQSIETTYLKNNSILEKAKKPSTNK